MRARDHLAGVAVVLLMALAWILPLIYAVGLIGPVPARAYERLLPEQGLRGLAWGALWVGLCGVAFVAFSRGRLKATGVALLALLVTAKAIYVTAYIPRREQRKSPREIAARVVARLPENVCSPSE